MWKVSFSTSRQKQKYDQVRKKTCFFLYDWVWNRNWLWVLDAPFIFKSLTWCEPIGFLTLLLLLISMFLYVEVIFVFVRVNKMIFLSRCYNFYVSVLLFMTIHSAFIIVEQFEEHKCNNFCCMLRRTAVHSIGYKILRSTNKHACMHAVTTSNKIYITENPSKAQF